VTPSSAGADSLVFDLVQHVFSLQASMYLSRQMLASKQKCKDAIDCMSLRYLISQGWRLGTSMEDVYGKRLYASIRAQRRSLPLLVLP